MGKVATLVLGIDDTKEEPPCAARVVVIPRVHDLAARLADAARACIDPPFGALHVRRIVTNGAGGDNRSATDDAFSFRSASRRKRRARIYPARRNLCEAMELEIEQSIMVVIALASFGLVAHARYRRSLAPASRSSYRLDTRCLHRCALTLRLAVRFGRGARVAICCRGGVLRKSAASSCTIRRSWSTVSSRRGSTPSSTCRSARRGTTCGAAPCRPRYRQNLPICRCRRLIFSPRRHALRRHGRRSPRRSRAERRPRSPR